MNLLKVTGGYGSLIAGILLAVFKHYELPISPEQVDYLSGVMVMIGGGLLHLAQAPFKK